MPLPPPDGRQAPYPLFHDSPADPTPTSVIHPATAAVTNLHHQPLELFNYSWTTQAPATSATASPPTSFPTLDNSDRANPLLPSRNQPKDMTSKTDLSPSPIALPPVSSSCSSSSQSSSSSPSSHQKPHPLFDPSHQNENKMMSILPFPSHDNLSNQFSAVQSNNNNNHYPPSSLYMDNNYSSRPSTAPSASFWSDPNNSTTVISAPTPTTTAAASILSSTNLADISFDDAFKSFPYLPHHNLPSSNIPNLNPLVPPSQTHPPHPPMMMNPSQDLLPRNELVSAPHYHVLISSPQSPSAGRLMTPNQFHPPHHPIYQQLYNPLSSNSGPIEHQGFPLPIHHPHPHLNGWQPSFDPVHLATCYDPFQIKHRRRTTPSQLSVLEAQFQTNCKPDVSLRKQLADQLDMTPREVQVWFQNRRAKTKKLERRAEQESGKSLESDSIPNASQSTTSPPATIYLSSPSLRGSALPVTQETPEEARTGVSPPRFVTSAATSKIDESEQETQHRLDSDRRYRSRSLHHHPYYLPSLNSSLPTSSNASNSLIGARTLNQQQQFIDGGDDSSMTGRRSSHTSNASSTATATDSNLVCTPTTTEFGSDHTIEFPDGYDPRRRSSCPAEFIQSFGHFGLAMSQPLDCSSQAGIQSSFIATSQACESVPKPALDANPFAVLVDHNQEWIKQQGYRNDAVREGIQRRHSLATMNSPTESQDNSNGQVSTTEFSTAPVFSSLFSMGTTRYPTPVLSGIDNNSLNIMKTNVARGGYARRASTSVLKSIEEHPGNL